LPGLRDTTQARRGVYGITDDGVRKRARAADVSGDQLARVNADTNGDRQVAPPASFSVPFTEELHLFEGRSDAAERVVVMDDGRSPDGHDAVAHELVEGALVFEDRVDHFFEILVEHLDDGLRLRALTHAGEAANIAVEDSALFDEAAAFLDGQRAGHDALGNVRREEARHTLARDDLVFHLLAEDVDLNKHRGLIRH